MDTLPTGSSSSRGKTDLLHALVRGLHMYVTAC